MAFKSLRLLHSVRLVAPLLPPSLLSSCACVGSTAAMHVFARFRNSQKRQLDNEHAFTPPVVEKHVSDVQTPTTVNTKSCCITKSSAYTHFRSPSTSIYAAPQKPAHGLTPPALDNSVHVIRCLEQLRSKDKPIEKYLYLSQLKLNDEHMFYHLCTNNMPVSVASFFFLFFFFLSRSQVHYGDCTRNFVTCGLLGRPSLFFL